MGKISVLRPRSADIHPILMLLTSHRMDCCMLCLRCVEMCPQKDALKLKFAGKDIFKSRNWLQTTKSGNSAAPND
jgi:ferredoxin